MFHNPQTRETEVGGSQVPGQQGLLSKAGAQWKDLGYAIVKARKAGKCFTEEREVTDLVF